MKEPQTGIHRGYVRFVGQLIGRTLVVLLLLLLFPCSGTAVAAGLVLLLTFGNGMRLGLGRRRGGRRRRFFLFVVFFVVVVVVTRRTVIGRRLWRRRRILGVL